MCDLRSRLSEVSFFRLVLLNTCLFSLAAFRSFQVTAALSWGNGGDPLELGQKPLRKAIALDSKCPRTDGGSQKFNVLSTICKN